MLHTTFALLRQHGACTDGYKKLAKALGGVKAYGQDKPIPLTAVLDSNGLDDTLWCLRAVLPEEKAERDKQARLLACDYAERALNREREDGREPGPSSWDAIRVARAFALGQATNAELAAAWEAAWAAAGVAAWVAAWAAERELQAERFREYLERSA